MTRPMFWGSTFVLLLIGICAWEYFEHPEWLNAIVDDKETEVESDNPASESTLSQKELDAIGADIDSSPVLMAELDRLNVPPAATLPKPKSEASKTEALLNELSSEAALKINASPPQGAAIPRAYETPKEKQNASNPFAASAQELLNAGPFANTTDMRNYGYPQNSSAAASTYNRSILGLNSPNSIGSNQSTTPSVAQSAYNRAILGLSSPNSIGSNQSTTPSAAESTYERSVLGASGPNSVSQNQNTTPVSPLQEALQQQALQNNFTAPAATATNAPANVSGQTFSTPITNEQITLPPASGTPNATNYSLPPNTGIANPTSYSLPPNASTANPTNAYTYLTQPPRVPSVPRTVPSSLPVIPLVPSNYVPNSTQYPIGQSGVTNPTYTSPIANPGLQPSQLGQPAYSIPSNVPGQ